jgi:formiminotetrahydrofolate cyclodeaminase
MTDPLVSSEASIRDFLTALGTADAAHGAVSAAAVAGGMGVALLLMVAALPTPRSASIADRLALTEARKGLSDIQQQLLEAIETETAVKVYAARQMPQSTGEQRAERERTIQLALRAVADVPLEVIRLSASALEHARTVAAFVRGAAASEAELAIALLRVAFTGARSNLEVKLSSLTDLGYAKTVVEEVARLSEESLRAAREAELLVQGPPA